MWVKDSNSLHQRFVQNDQVIGLRPKKKPRVGEAFKYLIKTGLFLSVFHVFGISGIEFIDTTCGINKFHFPSIERM